eukprot:TRINITY_DN12662_c0_g1_i1.p1 TRINITY_DN12662_c0_g1~~TRINITY_DN12662_c0_g1_i1.p1  ORF type:complete len:104 (+),score=25.82 TRINITY_DN12662_c0_g1_i1:387-698(+)
MSLLGLTPTAFTWIPMIPFCSVYTGFSSSSSSTGSTLPRTLQLSSSPSSSPVSYTHLRAHETPEHLVCRLLLEKKKKKTTQDYFSTYILYTIIYTHTTQSNSE